MNYLSFDFIAYVEIAQKFVPFPGAILPELDKSLRRKIEFYIKEERETTKLPLKNLRKLRLRFSEKLEMRAFGYASIYAHHNHKGNLTSHKLVQFNNCDLCITVKTKNCICNKNQY